jgi:hypothetical protein
MAMDGDGDPVVVVWIEEYDDSLGLTSSGHVHLRAASASTGWWGDKVTVYSGDGSACASRASVAVTGTTAHVAYVVWKPCAPDYTEVHHSVCEMTGGVWQCDGGEVITSTQKNTAPVGLVDVAVDADGDPRVVWAQYYESPPTSGQWYGTIYYRAKEDDEWGSFETVEDSGNNGTPAIAWANGYDHVVWEYETTFEGKRIRYERRSSSTGTWDEATTLFDDDDLSLTGSYPPANPDVAAGGGRVYATWDVDFDEYVPETYLVLYRRSDNDGVSFSAPWQVHPNYNPGHSNLAHYDPIDSSLLERLQPSIALSDEHLPGVAWHAARPDASEWPSVYYSTYISGTGWTSPTVLISDGNDLGIGAATVARSEEDGTPFLHIAYMRKWDGLNWDIHHSTGSEVIPDYPTVYLPLVSRNN